MTDASDTTTYAYDPLNRLTRLRTQGLSPQGTVPVLDLTYTYDSSGRRTSMTDASDTTTYAYDALNRLTRVERRELSPM